MISINTLRVHKPIGSRLSVGTILFFLLLTAHTAVAGINTLTCEAYAASADRATSLMGWVEGSTKNARYKTMSDDRTQPIRSDHISHVVWCAGARIESLANEEVARLQDLNGRRGRDVMCDQYVNDVDIANRENAGRSDYKNGPLAACGYRGNRWGGDLNAHRNWCKAAKLEDVYSEERGRILDVDRCDACQDYANQARDDRNLATKTRGCTDLKGPRWSNDRNVHVGWCMNARYSSVWDERSARMHEAVSCK